MIKNYIWKFNYLAEHYKRKCPIAAAHGVIITLPVLFEGQERRPDYDLHHYRIHNLKINRKRWPLLIDSLINLLPVSHGYHMAHGSFGERWGPYRCDQAENYLIKHNKINQFVNGVLYANAAN